MRRLLWMVSALLLLAMLAFGQPVSVPPLASSADHEALKARMAAVELRATAIEQRTTTLETTVADLVKRVSALEADPPTPPPSPTPVDCSGNWLAWTTDLTNCSACVDSSQTCTQTRTFTVIQQPLYGGAACPSSPETSFVTQACTVTPPPPPAGSVTATSCNQVDVQAAVSKAVTGNRVIVPAGSCTWASPINIAGKNLILQGAGKTATLISTTRTAVNLATTSSRVTEFSFTLTAPNEGPIIRADGQQFRVDNNRLHCGAAIGFVPNGVYSAGVHSPGAATAAIPHPRGVIDSNEFIGCRVLVAGDLWLLAHAIWAEPSGLGTDNAVFVEDNTFDGWNRLLNNVVDSNYGGRYVFRYNHGTNLNHGPITHSVQGNHRASRSFEMYHNTLSTNAAVFTSIWPRGGSGVIFNNTITGPYTFPIAFDNVRSVSPGGCNGSSPWDGNANPPGNGWPCRDQMGRGKDLSLWTTASPYPKQESEPVYLWGNTHNGAPAKVTVINCASTIVAGGSCAHLQTGRDFIEGTPKPGYTPFTYPHPLRSIP